MDKEELKALLIEHLTIRIEKEWDYYQEDPDIKIVLEFDGQVIMETKTW